MLLRLLKHCYTNCHLISAKNESVLNYRVLGKNTFRNKIPSNFSSFNRQIKPIVMFIGGHIKKVPLFSPQKDS